MCCSSLSIEPVSFSCWGMSIGGEGGRELGQPLNVLQSSPNLCTFVLIKHTTSPGLECSSTPTSMANFIAGCEDTLKVCSRCVRVLPAGYWRLLW